MYDLGQTCHFILDSRLKIWGIYVVFKRTKANESYFGKQPRPKTCGNNGLIAEDFGVWKDLVSNPQTSPEATSTWVRPSNGPFSLSTRAKFNHHNSVFWHTVSVCHNSYNRSSHSKSEPDSVGKTKSLKWNFFLENMSTFTQLRRHSPEVWIGVQICHARICWLT